MTSVDATSDRLELADAFTLQQLDDELERIPSLTEDERSVIWLYAWASRETAARVASLAD